MTALLPVAAKTLLYSATTIIWGIAVTGWPFRNNPSRLAASALSALLPLAPLLWLEAQREALEFGFSEVPVLLGTGWGREWTILTAATVVGAYALFTRSQLLLIRIAALALAWSLGGLGHANAAESWPFAARLLDAVHVAAMGAWVGTLALAVCEAGPDELTPVARWMKVSRIAVVAAPLAIATGLLNALRIAGGPVFTVVTGSSWGRLLALKVGIVVVMLALGGLSHLRIKAGSAPHSRSLLTEVALAIVVVVVTAVLTGASPPIGMSLEGSSSGPC